MGWGCGPPIETTMESHWAPLTALSGDTEINACGTVHTSMKTKVWNVH